MSEHTEDNRVNGITNEGSAGFGILDVVQHTVIDLGHGNVEHLGLLRQHHWGWHGHSAGLVLIVAAARAVVVLVVISRSPASASTSRLAATATSALVVVATSAVSLEA